MARMRSLKPEYWDDEELATATSRDARLLYPALWNLADEHGRLRGDPRYIKGKVFAYDDDLMPADVDALINQLARIGKVVRYRVGGARYLYLPKLANHQRLEPDKVPSRLPSPEGAEPEPDPPSGKFSDESARRANKSAPNRTEEEDRWADGWDAQVEQPERSRANKSARGTDESALASARLFSREHVAGGISPPSAGAVAPRADEPATNLSPTQRSKRITDAYAKAEPMCRWPAINGIVLTALKAGRWTDDQIRDALLRLAATRRSVTVDTLRVELDGQPPPGNVVALARASPRRRNGDDIVAEGLEIAARLQAQEQQ